MLQKLAGFLTDFQQMCQDLTEQDIQDWLWADRDDLGYEHLDDDSIVNHVAGSSNDEVDSDDESDDGGPSEISTTEPAISHKDAMVIFDKCLVAVPARSNAPQHQCAAFTEGNCSKQTIYSNEAAHTYIIFYNRQIKSNCTNACKLHIIMYSICILLFFSYRIENHNN